MIQGQTILIIDDERNFVSLVKGRLEKKGYRALTAFNGQQGLDLLEKERPDLIILDINMPVMGGIEFYRQISDDKSIPKYPVLILTARAELRKLFSEINADGFIAKPFEAERLYADIDLILKKNAEKKYYPKNKDRKNILLVEDKISFLDKIAQVFVDSGYTVKSSSSGLDVLEKIIEDLPDLFLIKLSLPDLAGDIVAAKLKKMARTSDIPLVLYTFDPTKIDYVVENKICSKIGIEKIILAKNPSELLKEGERALKQAREAEK